MRTDKAGNRLYRKMTVKIIFPAGIFTDRTYMQHAGPRQGFSPDGVDQMLLQIADDLDSLYPWWNFEPVELSPIGSTIRFVFKFVGNNTNYVPPAPTTNPTADSSTLGPETTEGIQSVSININADNTPQSPSSQELVPGESDVCGC